MRVQVIDEAGHELGVAELRSANLTSNKHPSATLCCRNNVTELRLVHHASVEEAVKEKRDQDKFYHELASGPLQLSQFQRNPVTRFNFDKWASLYGFNDLTDYQMKCFDIHVQIGRWDVLAEHNWDVLGTLPVGVSLIEDFVTEAEEDILLAHYDAPSKWIQQLSRRVQHYGHTFVYQSLYIDTRPGICPPLEISEQCAAKVVMSQVMDRVAKVAGWTQSIDQLTINEYRRGQGIGFHVDTHSAFTDAIAVVSLVSGIEMSFRPDRTRTDGERRVYLPRRSLLVFAGEARYNWYHGIKSRKIDYDVRTGEPLLRGDKRISLTFRQLNWRGSFMCRCQYPDKCDTQNPSSLKRPDRL